MVVIVGNERANAKAREIEEHVATFILQKVKLCDFYPSKSKALHAE